MYMLKKAQSCCLLLLDQYKAKEIYHKKLFSFRVNSKDIIVAHDIQILTFHQQPSHFTLGYVPADLTVHPPPPPQNCRGWVHFFRIGV